MWCNWKFPQTWTFVKDLEVVHTSKPGWVLHQDFPKTLLKLTNFDQDVVWQDQVTCKRLEQTNTASKSPVLYSFKLCIVLLTYFFGGLVPYPLFVFLRYIQNK